MISTREAQFVSKLFYLLDTNVRHELHNDRIADERDYVSKIATHFNYPFGIFNSYIFNKLNLQSKWFNRVNNGQHERKFGCDSMLVFKVKDKIKVGLFEAKWPRVIKNPDYFWDYPQKASKKSHFTDQIIRQAKWSRQAAIWEMFFYEGKVGLFKSPFDKNASTCVRHEFAKNLVDNKRDLDIVWNNSDLEDLIKSEQVVNTQTNIESIVFGILTCKFGLPITVIPANKEFTIVSNDGADKVICPILDMVSEDESNERIETFMATNGLSFFQQIDILPVIY